MNEEEFSFDSAFRALTDFIPMRWQTRLYNRMLSGKLPKVVNIPTGLGKTSVIPIWLIALITGDRRRNSIVPRRLVYIVNRRTVVDQATDIVLKIRKRLLDPNFIEDPRLRQQLSILSQRLRGLTSNIDSNPLAITTLRGEVADNEEWKLDPARPAIIIGTIDMIGSKLLFSGYGDGRYHRAHHAGLIGQDSLVVHDEAHLTPAFSELLFQISELQRKNKEMRSILMMELSATPSSYGSEAMGLEPQDEDEPIVRERIHAEKTIYFHSIDEKEIVNKIAELANRYESLPSKVLIYVRFPETSRRVVDILKKQHGAASEQHIALLTGTIRGHERNMLVRENPVYLAFVDHKKRVERSMYLVSTSAGEIGVDFDADHIICDATTLDSIIQRLGRVNRCGGAGATGAPRHARVDIVVVEGKKASKDSLHDRIIRTNEILTRLPKTEDGGYSASSRNMLGLLSSISDSERIAAFSPKSVIKPLTDILVDSLSMSSANELLPGRPHIAQYLHGVTPEPLETFLVWRKELKILADIEESALEDWFRSCRIETHERLRERTDVVKKTLKDLLEEHRKKDPDKDFRVVVLDERGNATSNHLSKITQKEFDINYRTIVLPSELGGLTKEGMLSPDALDEAQDVAEISGAGKRRRERWLHIKSHDSSEWIKLMTGEEKPSPPEELWESERITLKEAPEISETPGESRFLVLLSEKERSSVEDPERAKFKQALDDHNQLVVHYIERISTALELNASLLSALVTAARLHDNGKRRPIWQLYAYNKNTTEPLAKSDRYQNPRLLGGYRHEFESMLDAMNDENVLNNPERDLILHLIAAHHGWGRPHFKPEASDPSSGLSTNERAIIFDVARRFSRLQRQYGPWTLAWLEALLKCADILASKYGGRAQIDDEQRGVEH